MKTTGIAIIVALGVSAGASANSLTMSFLGFGDSTVAGIRYNSNLAFNSRSDSSFTNITIGEHRWGVYSQECTTFCVQQCEQPLRQAISLCGGAVRSNSPVT